MSDADPQKVIESEVLDLNTQQKELAELQDALSQNEQFTRFMDLSKKVSQKMSDVRAHIEKVMIPAYEAGQVEKSIKGDWGSVTVTESNKFDIDEAVLPAKFYKKVVDETKIRKTYELEGTAPKGCTPHKKYGIMLKLK